MVLAKRV